MRLIVDNTKSVGGDYSHVACAYAGTASEENPAPHSHPVRASSHGQVEPQRLSSSPVAGAVNLYSPWSIHREYLP